MRPIAELQAMEMRSAAADEARRSSRRAAFVEPGNDYLARMLRPLADAQAFCRRSTVSHGNPPVRDDGNVSPRAPEAHGNVLMEFPTQW